MILFSLFLAVMGAMLIELTKRDKPQITLQMVVRQLLVYSTAIGCFFPSAHFLFHTPLIPPPVIASIGFLLLVVYIATNHIKSTIVAIIHAAVAGGLAFPTLLWLATPGGALAQWGYHDIAGGGMVHLFGGLLALLSVASSKHKIEQYKTRSLPGAVMLILGWVAYIGCISAELIQDSFVWVNGITNLIIGVVASALTSVVLANKNYIHALTIGAIGGIAITSTDPFVYSHIDATLLGVTAGLIAWIVTWLLEEDTTAFILGAHLLPGALGVLVVPWFHSNTSEVAQLVGAYTVVCVAVVAHLICMGAYRTPKTV